VTSFEKTLAKVLRGTSDTNIRFTELTNLLEGLGFRERIRGSHRIFRRDDIEEIIALQPHGSKAKCYRVKQVRELILEYGLGTHGKE
jgi:predicted RNA binding protein YcfA (HicA-like mRNA interferase family)